MTEKAETQHKTLRIPSREEFHRYASNILTEWDFCTDFPPALNHGQADRVASAIRWTKANAVGRTYNYKKY